MDDWHRVVELPLAAGEEITELKPADFGLLAKTSMGRTFLVDVDGHTCRELVTQPPSYATH